MCCCLSVLLPRGFRRLRWSTGWIGGLRSRGLMRDTCVCALRYYLRMRGRLLVVRRGLSKRIPGGGRGDQFNASGSNWIRVVFAAAAAACWSTRLQSTARMNLLSTDLRMKPKKIKFNEQHKKQKKSVKKEMLLILNIMQGCIFCFEIIPPPSPEIFFHNFSNLKKIGLHTSPKFVAAGGSGGTPPPPLRENFCKFDQITA